MLHCAQNIWARHISILYICRKGKNNQMHSTEKKKERIHSHFLSCTHSSTKLEPFPRSPLFDCCMWYQVRSTFSAFQKTNLDWNEHLILTEMMIFLQWDYSIAPFYLIIFTFLVLDKTFPEFFPLSSMEIEFKSVLSLCIWKATRSLNQTAPKVNKSLFGHRENTF